MDDKLVNAVREAHDAMDGCSTLLLAMAEDPSVDPDVAHALGVVAGALVDADEQLVDAVM
jgi:hypothetical protein